MPEIAEDAALMRMEVAGICGTDVKLYEHPPSAAPVIMGHENIGYIEKCGKEFTRRKALKECTRPGALRLSCIRHNHSRLQ
jgi:D-arabinose 1-dehydrogenase-like Zn-dependent alcohol dehydrogenase